VSDEPFIVSTAPAPAEVFAGLLPGTRVVKAEHDELFELAPDIDILIGDWTHKIHIEAGVIGRMRRCRLIQQPTAGFENIDIDAADDAGIPVANAGPANSGAVAEHAIMLTLGCLRRLAEAHRDAVAGGWDQRAWIDRDLPELEGRVVGILGLGSIGMALAERLRPFGCRVLYNKRTRLSADEEARLGASFARLEHLLRDSEVLIVCLPLNSSSRGLLSATRLALLPAGAIVVNVARGDVMDYGALAAELRSGRLSGAGLDVYPEEPMPVDHALGALPNVLLTPHIGGATAQAKRNIFMNSVSNISRVLNGEAPLHVVNRPRARA
jgi:phosphoglycerate dehydrogenase-like enzyme